MTDTIFAKPQKPMSLPDATRRTEGTGSSLAHAVLASADGAVPDATLIEMIELLFFAYRDFVSDPDAILAEFGFGRAHHRVLYFVNRNPGMTVAELLDILKITKQSLGRVLRDLIEAQFIVQRPGEADRRQRLLYPTADGEALARRLTEPQMRRIGAALAELEADGSEVTSRFLRLMINEADRPSAPTPSGPRLKP